MRALLNARIISVLRLKGIDNIFTRKAFDLILTGFTVDKAPADNNVTLPGYGTNTAGFLFKLTAFFQKLLAFFHSLFTC